jgi:hypothetical protein
MTMSRCRQVDFGSREMGKLARLSEFFLTRKDQITVLKDIVTIIAILVTAVSLVVAIGQFSLAANTLRINMMYQISHEGRDIAKALKPDMSVRDIGQAMSFVHVIWYVHEHGAFDDELWQPFNTEVCVFIGSQQNFSSYWNVSRQLFPARFGEFVDERRRQCES